MKLPATNREVQFFGYFMVFIAFKIVYTSHDNE